MSGHANWRTSTDTTFCRAYRASKRRKSGQTACWGERLFLHWLLEDTNAGKIKADDLPFVKPEEVAEYVAKQDTPLLQRIARDGITESPLAKRDAGAMDLYTGLALYSDAVNGTNALRNALSYTAPRAQGTFVQAPDFLRGVEMSSTGRDWTLPTPVPSRPATAKPIFGFICRAASTQSACPVSAQKLGVRVRCQSHSPRRHKRNSRQRCRLA